MKPDNTRPPLAGTAWSTPRRGRALAEEAREAFAAYRGLGRRIIDDLIAENEELANAQPAPAAGDGARNAAEEIAQEYRESLSKALGSSASGVPTPGVVEALSEIIARHFPHCQDCADRRAASVNERK